MRRPNLWDDARARARSVLEKTTPADQAALFTFDRRVHPLVSFDQWNSVPAAERVELAVRKLGENSPGWLATDLGAALVTAAETLADTTAKPSSRALRQIIVISDLQEGSRLEALQNYEWSKEINLQIEALRAAHSDNASPQLITALDEEKHGNGASLRVRVGNEPFSKKEQFKIGWVQSDGRTFVEKPIDLYVPAGQSRTLILPTLTNGVSSERILLQGDDNDFDNTVFAVPPEQTRLNVLYCGAASEHDSRGPLYFLRRAFQETQRQSVQLLVRSENQPFLPEDAKAAALYIVTGTLTDDHERLVREQVAAGKMLLFSLANESTAPSLARLMGISRIEVEPANPNRYAMLAEVDFNHPLFAPFADPRFSDFTKIHFWKYTRFDATTLSGAHILAKFDNGDPAIVEVPVGKGRVIILAFGWGAEESQFALSTKFVPFLYSLLEQSSGARQFPGQYFVGDSLPLASVADLNEITIKTPGGDELKVPASETNFSKTLAPGIYRVASPRPYRFAVNLDASESRTAPLSPDELEKRGLALSSQSVKAAAPLQQRVRLHNAELENRQKLWRDLLIAALAILLLESWLAGRTTRRPTVKV